MQTIYWAKYLGLNPTITNGSDTGVYKKTYANAIKVKANIAPVISRSGAVSVEGFGSKFKHDKIILINKTISITVNDLFWIDIEKNANANYVVSGIYPTKNALVVGLNVVV